MAGIDDAPAACRTCAFLVKCFAQDAAELAERPAILPEGWLTHPVIVDGTATRVIRCPGDGLPVVMLHGEAGTADRWLFNLNALARAGHDVHAPDLPHHGFADRAGAATVDRYAGFLGAYLRRLGRPAVVVGASIAANVAARLAVRQPDLVAGLVLVGGGPAPYGEDVRNRLRRLAYYRSREGGRERLRRAVHDPRLAAPQMVEQEFRCLEAPGGQASMAALSDHIATAIDDTGPDAAGWARLRGIPTLLVWGEKDSIVPPAYARALADRLEAGLLVLSHAGHLPNYERPGEVNQAVLRFLEGLPEREFRQAG